MLQDEFSILNTNIDLITKKIHDAAQRSIYVKLSDITLVAVSKTVSSKAISYAYSKGLRVFGENYVQNVRDKSLEIPDIADKISWHMIGHLQKNKAGMAVKYFDVIHTVDSTALAYEIDKKAGQIGKIQRILIQIKMDEEPTKKGTSQTDLFNILKDTKELKNIKIDGLMIIPPYFPNPEDVRPYFKRLRDIRDEADLKELSMGMSNDFETAIEEGATMIRIGTALFGERNYLT
ncbi:MAG: YggS family pyridoxal phosphate-dependent enzyme [Nitrospirae bacterium]|nr:YggS family pyridoxal phosphate-dependent enzyme [Nitrospirota bacterium]